MKTNKTLIVVILVFCFGLFLTACPSEHGDDAEKETFKLSYYRIDNVYQYHYPQLES
ncbi:MAG: hypothetical protein FWE84_04180 [Firmicutes bacterium]|nr:hypothetical protein [Bacillota bacterium]